MRAAHVPMEILRLQVESEHIGENRIHAATDVRGGFGAKIGWRHQWGFAPLLEFSLFRIFQSHDSASGRAASYLLTNILFGIRTWTPRFGLSTSCVTATLPARLTSW